MEFWPEFLGKDGIKEFAAGGLGGMAGVIAGYPLDTVRIRIQQPQVGTSGGPASPFTLLKEIVKKEGPFALYKGMASPLATVAFQNAVTFHAYAALTRNLQPLLDGHHRRPRNDAATPPPTSPAPPSYRVVALAGMGAGALQTLILTPVDLVKIQLQLRTGKVGTPKLRGSVNAIRSGVQELRSSVKGVAFSRAASSLDAMGGKPGTGQVSSATPAVAARGAAQQAPAGAGSVGTGGALGGAQGGPIRVVRGILQREGVRGLYRGLGVTVLRDAPSHGVYFATYEWMREMLHPGCRGSGNEGMTTMLVAGGTAGAASWLGCYPIDVCKSRLQAQGASGRYSGLADCLRKSVREEGLGVLVRGLGTTMARAFIVNAAIFTAYEMTLRSMQSSPPPPPQQYGL
eukprot:jgi/Mesen1/8974/ME000056S08375